MENLLRIFPLASDLLKAHDRDSRSEESGSSAVKSEVANILSSSHQPLLLISHDIKVRLALLFQCALTYASEGRNVLFVRRHPLEQLPPTVHGMPKPLASVLKNVKFVYYTSARELVTFCANVHSQTAGPEVILIADLEYYVQQTKDLGSEQTLVKLCCLVIDAAKFLQQKSCKPIPVVMSLDDSFTSLSKVMWRFPVQLAAVSGPVGDDGEHHLNMTTDKHHVTCVYKVGVGELLLTDLQVTTQRNPP